MSSPELNKFIDGPVDPTYLDQPHRMVATDFVNQVRTYIGGLSQEHQDQSQCFRITTWVEDHEAEQGYTFGLSQLRPLPGVIGGYAITSSFSRKNLVSWAIEEENLSQHAEISTADNIRENTDRMVDVYSKHDLIYMLAMIRKVKLAIADKKHHTSVDGRALHGLNIEYGQAKLGQEPTNPN